MKLKSILLAAAVAADGRCFALCQCRGRRGLRAPAGDVGTALGSAVAAYRSGDLGACQGYGERRSRVAAGGGDIARGFGAGAVRGGGAGGGAQYLGGG